MQEKNKDDTNVSLKMAFCAKSFTMRLATDPLDQQLVSKCLLTLAKVEDLQDITFDQTNMHRTQHAHSQHA